MEPAQRLEAATLIAELESVLAGFSGGEVSWPSDADEYLALLDRARRAEAALRSSLAVMVADADRGRVAERGAGTSITTWLTNSGQATSGEAARLLFQGRALNARPQVRQAALVGEVLPEQAASIGAVLDGLPRSLTDEQRERAGVLLLATAASRNSTHLRRMGQVVLDAVSPIDPQADAAEREAKRHEAQRIRAHQRRSLKWRTEDGSVIIHGSLPLVEGEAFTRILDAYRASEHRSGDDRLDPLETLPSPSQRAADALGRMVAEHQRGRLAPAVAGDRPRVVVIMHEDALRSRTEQAGLLGSGDYVSAGELRRLCCDADIAPVVLGGVSEVLDVGRADRLVTPAIRRALALRDGGCAFPGCGQTEVLCEAHHIKPWWAGGETCLANLVLLCGHHHALIEPERFAEQWSNTSDPPGPRQRWEVRLDEYGIAEFLPPARLDALRVARSRGAWLGRGQPEVSAPGSEGLAG